MANFFENFFAVSSKEPKFVGLYAAKLISKLNKTQNNAKRKLT